MSVNRLMQLYNFIVVIFLLTIKENNLLSLLRFLPSKINPDSYFQNKMLYLFKKVSPGDILSLASSIYSSLVYLSFFNLIILISIPSTRLVGFAYNQYFSWTPFHDFHSFHPSFLNFHNF